jgi:RHS repeat-associated protein
MLLADLLGYRLTENVLDPYGNTVTSKRYETLYETIPSEEPNGEDEERVIGWNVYYFTINTDIRGSTTNIIRPDGSMVSGYVYDEFGNQIKTGDEDFLNDATYTGAIYDSETELQYMNARYYDSSSGRFISQDSYPSNLTNPQNQHLYAYIANNPIIFIEPTGHQQMEAEQSAV